jgi:DNA-damage-inducible protein J
MSHIQIRIDIEEKRAAQKVLDSMGLSLSGAIKLFLKKVVQEQRIPFEISAESKPIKVTPAEFNGFAKRRIG